MKLEALAKAYIDCVELDERVQRDGGAIAEDIAILRADLHALWMDALRQARISFTDRAHAARLAFEIASKKQKTA